MNNKGFTLIELLVVIAIIGILAAILVTGVTTIRGKARTGAVKAQLAIIEKAMAQMAIDTNAWPHHQYVDCVQTAGVNEVANLNTPAAGITTNDVGGSAYAGWHGPYMNSVPLDPWGSNYFLDTDYYVKDNGDPCAGVGGSTAGCTAVVAIGSLGPVNDGGINDYDADNIIKIISRELTCQ